MSRLGKRPVEIPQGVTVNVAGVGVSVKGKLGELKQNFHPAMTVKVDGNQISVVRPSDSKQHRELHGLTRALLQNMVNGVSKGYNKELEIVGVGWNAKMKGAGEIQLQVGFCHTVDVKIPAGVKVELPNPQRVNITGIDKQIVGQFAAELHASRPPEPYKGKGVRYVGEHIIRKVGKSQVGK